MKPRLIPIIKRIEKNDTVLDIGCVQHSAEAERQDDWLHGLLEERCKHIIGIDYLKDEVEILQNRGYNIKHKNAETFDLEEKFDKIIAAELIEHLSNPGMFLDQAADHLKNDGELIITTPNPWAINRLLDGIYDEITCNPEHTCWFDKNTIEELLSISGFSIKKLSYIEPNHSKKISLKYPYFLAPARICFDLGFDTRGGPNFIIVAEIITDG